MKVEVTVELDINLSKASITDIKKILDEMINAKKIDVLESVHIKDIKLGK
ncbi:hypothetical protein SAMN05216326_12213 [Nitrosomonas marina]|uniref:Uncharacterized protein n=1 Tax=Nitrosomonas marina TaxID=917 RepID=A0A1I0DS24_9PROT|nr:hypothetical protein [Nitrosomonas marina]SET35086.1 hypothetical protein SAMN05216326_12213 [Nitrosomonas marina]